MQRAFNKATYSGSTFPNICDNFSRPRGLRRIGLFRDQTHLLGPEGGYHGWWVVFVCWLCSGAWASTSPPSTPTDLSLCALGRGLFGGESRSSKSMTSAFLSRFSRRFFLESFSALQIPVISPSSSSSQMVFSLIGISMAILGFRRGVVYVASMLGRTSPANC